MCKRNLRLLVSLCTIVTFAFSNVTLTLQSNGNLDYDSDSDIYGFQFSQNGCVTGASGGDADAAGFMISASAGVVLGFSMSGGYIPAGCGTRHHCSRYRIYRNSYIGLHHNPNTYCTNCSRRTNTGP